MKQNYIKEIRSLVGHRNIFLNFSAGALFNEKREILLQKRGDTKKWGLPGGAIELGENFVDALEREFLEETNFIVTPGKLLGVFTDDKHTIIYPNGDMCQPIVVLFEVKTKSSEIKHKKDNETLDLKFFNKENLPNITNLQHQEMIETALKNIGQ